MVLQWLTEPVCWCIGCGWLPYSIFRRAATDDGQHADLLVALGFYAAMTTVQNLPVVEQIIVWFPFFYEIKLLMLALLAFAGGSRFCYERFVAPVFQRFAKTPEELASRLPHRLRTSYDGAESLQTFASKFVETTPTMLAEYGPDAYRVVMAMLIQSSKDQAMGMSPIDTETGGIHAIAGFMGQLTERVTGRLASRGNDMVTGAIKTSIEAGMKNAGASI
eukprot:g143.t1